MEEGTLSNDGVVYPMARPFMVVATQNPIDMEGTYVLPEAQLDRFLMKLTVGYPSARGGGCGAVDAEDGADRRPAAAGLRRRTRSPP